MINLTFDSANSFKEYLKSTKENDFSLDVESMNIFDDLKFVILSSTYFYQKYPDKKLKCKTSKGLQSLISSFEVKNLEFV